MKHRRSDTDEAEKEAAMTKPLPIGDNAERNYVNHFNDALLDLASSRTGIG